MIGVDYAGPIKYRTRGRKEGKAYIVLFACSLTRGLYLELLPELTTDEFLGSLKRLIARRGKLNKIYSDNGKTFIAAAKQLKQVEKDEKFEDWLARQGVKWQFNLSRAPWWAGQFERLEFERPSEAVPLQDHWQWKSTTDKASRGHFGRRDNSQQSPSWLYGRQR